MVAEPVYKGATRPAMWLGIPLVPLVLACGAAALVALWGGLLVSGWLALGAAAVLLPALGWMRWVTSVDDQRFHQSFLALRLSLRARNRRLWHGRSYAPTVYRGTRDAWLG